MNEDVQIKPSKIRRLMQEYPKGLVLLSSWLVSKGYSYELQQRYRNNGWLESIGKGAMVKSGDTLSLFGALSALQFQATINLHYGGRSALELHGNTHYLRFTSNAATLFAPGQTKLPSWFMNNKWDVDYQVFNASLFRNDTVGITDYQEMMIETKISSPARAMIESLSLCPKEFSLHEAYELMEGLSTLRPKQVQELLEECKSIKIKRLFLYFAERAGHSWFKHIDQTKISLGSGNRSITPNGVLTPKYSLVLPKDLVE
ncbi:MAG: type IV toxin-antitoxin system AbiEi family antitoxin [Tannerellaceae bacterium]|jgi:hypothetical protein|nr:type IV toxin-antitoxin system AbiEi family antitoxin [Tannerellaceae bacterium]